MRDYERANSKLCAQNSKQHHTHTHIAQTQKNCFVLQIIFHKHSNIFVIYYCEMKNGWGEWAAEKKKWRAANDFCIRVYTFKHGFCAILRSLVFAFAPNSQCTFYSPAKMLFTEKALNGKTNRTYVAGKWAKFRVDPFDKAYREGNAPTNKHTHPQHWLSHARK